MTHGWRGDVPAAPRDAYAAARRETGQLGGRPRSARAVERVRSARSRPGRVTSRAYLSCQSRPLYTERVLTGAVIDTLSAADVRAYLVSYGLQTA